MRRRRSPFAGLGLDRLNIFVPAIMSVGMAFWLVAVVRDVFRWRADESLERRSIIAGRHTAALVHGDGRSGDPRHVGLRHRPAYLLVAIALGMIAAYLFLNSLFNYRRDDGYVEGVSSLLAVATVGAGGLVFVAAAALATFVAWPGPSARWVRAVRARTPLSRIPLDSVRSGDEPSWLLSAAVMLLPAMAVVTGLFVAARWRPVVWFDEVLIETFDATAWLARLRFVDPLGATGVAIVLAGAVGVATLRCRPLAFAYPLAVVIGLAVTEISRNLVERARPTDGSLAGMTDSFPSGHVVQATLIAGLFPLGLAALTGSRRLVWPTRTILGLGVIAGAVHRVHADLHWPSDVVAGALIGLSLVVAVQWTLDHEPWHRWCRGCLWSPESHGPAPLGVIDVHVSVRRAIRWIAHLWAAAAVLALTLLTLVVGVPTDPGEGAVFGPDVQQPVQLGLAGIVSIGVLVSWKWDALGAVLIAVAGAALGIFAALEYPPLTAFGLALMLLAPAVLLWLGWQHRRTMAEILALATVTVLLVGATWVGVNQVHDFYFGPTHPSSQALFLPVDEVEWVWLGALSSDAVTITVGLDDDDEDVVLVAEPVDGGRPVRVEVDAADTTPAARFRLEGLEAETEYTYRVEIEGTADRSRGRGRFRTAPEGPASFRFVVGSCARTDSNGAVFDAMVARDPLFFLHLGDFHYGNIESGSPGAYRAAYARALGEPGPAALYRSIPTAYVWDDHDYGPNDSDASSSGRAAVQQAYREVVPHYDLAEPRGGPIHQAFTIGRVRFVLTDSRSERTAASMLGAEQRTWLIDELTTSARTHALVVWGNPVPWIGEASPGADSWAGWAEERGEIADALASAGVDNLVILSGDAHMVALDDGTNSDYSTAQAGGYPVLHAAALDRPGATKGGPYSHGAFAGGGQYGLVEITDEGGDITVTLSGHSWDGETLVEEAFTFPAATVSAG